MKNLYKYFLGHQFCAPLRPALGDTSPRPPPPSPLTDYFPDVACYAALLSSTNLQ